jgi:hypothetical protein
MAPPFGAASTGVQPGVSRRQNVTSRVHLESTVGCPSRRVGAGAHAGERVLRPLVNAQRRVDRPSRPRRRSGVNPAADAGAGEGIFEISRK